MYETGGGNGSLFCKPICDLEKQSSSHIANLKGEVRSFGRGVAGCRPGSGGLGGGGGRRGEQLKYKTAIETPSH